MTKVVIHVIDDDEAMRDSLSYLLDSHGMSPKTYVSAIQFLEQIDQAAPGCIVTDVRMPQMTGLELVRKLRQTAVNMPVIVITGHGDVPLAVEAMTAGAANFLEKPFEEQALLEAIRTALETVRQGAGDNVEKARLQAIISALSPREREVLDGVVAGQMNKQIAFDLGISPRTIEVYRANMMSKTGARNLSELVQMVMLARS